MLKAVYIYIYIYEADRTDILIVICSTSLKDVNVTLIKRVYIFRHADGSFAFWLKLLFAQ